MLLKHGLAGLASVTGSSWSPSDDPNIDLWFDATVGVTGSPTVTAIADQSGNGNNSTQIGGTPQTGGTQNGLNKIVFDGTEYIEVNSITLGFGGGTGNLAVHFAGSIGTVNNIFDAVLSSDAVTGNADWQLESANGSQFDGYGAWATIGTAFYLTGGPFSGWDIISIIFDWNGGTSGTAEVFIGNTSRGSDTYTSEAISAAQIFRVFSNRGENQFLAGEFGEVILTGSIDNRADYHTYLSGRWIP